MESTDKMKRQPSEWEKIFANDMTYKEFISKIYNQLTQLKIKKTKNKQKLNLKMCKRPEQTFFQRKCTWPIGI